MKGKNNLSLWFLTATPFMITGCAEGCFLGIYTVITTAPIWIPVMLVAYFLTYKKCPYCKKQINRKATRCHRCGGEITE